MIFVPPIRLLPYLCCNLIVRPKILFPDRFFLPDPSPPHLHDFVRTFVSRPQPPFPLPVPAMGPVPVTAYSSSTKVGSKSVIYTLCSPPSSFSVFLFLPAPNSGFFSYHSKRHSCPLFFFFFPKRCFSLPPQLSSLSRPLIASSLSPSPIPRLSAHSLLEETTAITPSEVPFPSRFTFDFKSFIHRASLLHAPFHYGLCCHSIPLLLTSFFFYLLTCTRQEAGLPAFFSSSLKSLTSFSSSLRQ